MERLQPVDENWDTGLVVVAHPDDIEYGAASAVARWVQQGKRMTYLLLTRGEAGIDSINPERAARLRTGEEIKSARAVGVDDVRFLDYPDGVLEYSLALRRDIAKVVREVKPDVCVTLNHREFFPENKLNMADHRVAGAVLIDAIRDSGNRWVFPELIAEGREPWNGVRSVLVNNSPYPTHAVDIDETIDKGVESLKQQTVYLKNLDNPPDVDRFLRGIARTTGGNYPSTYAAAFECIPMR